MALQHPICRAGFSINFAVHDGGDVAIAGSSFVVEEGLLLITANQVQRNQDFLPLNRSQVHALIKHLLRCEALLAEQGY
jgi:hypothetical protein